MTPAELTARREAMGLSYRRCAALLGVNPSSLYRWEHGKRAVPALLDAALSDFERRRQPGQIPASADVWYVMQRADVDQDTAVKILGGIP